MKRAFRVVLACFPFLGGCYNIDHFSSQMDQAVTHVAEGSKALYEARLVSLRRFGPMYSVQLDNGVLMDVDEVPPGLMAGDVVRIYQTEKGYVVHLWHRDAAPPQLSFK